ncbi:50S ribosomal protein L23 [Candidatus Woesearchaeota archaeon]|nr:50S ribosomal protein L23 [Candidatus Woesearchaeota archaeon]
MDPYTIVKYPVASEKAIRLMEAENKLLFRVDMKARKEDIKKAIETMFKTKVTQVRTLVTTAGEKRAYVTFSKETPAIDIATQLGIL